MENKKVPFFSIITVCYNAESEIERTICSVLEQSDTDYEYLIVDGKSSDKTLEIVEKYGNVFQEKRISMNIISEHDQGIFDAMNKGIRHAHGSFINFMNAGDSFYDRDVLKKIKEYLSNSKADIVYGNCYRYNQYYSYLSIPGDIELLKKGMAISHQASFIKKELQEKHLFSLKYRIASDHDLFLRLYLQGYQFEYIPLVVCNFSLGGVSSSSLLDAYKETYMVRVDNKVVNPHKLSTKVRYLCGYVERGFEMMLPVKLKWQLKAVKKKYWNDLHKK